MLLFRPTGLKELQLVYESGMRSWPPRLPEQPIFYPVLNYGYAAQIARDWNTKSNFFAGYVTEFSVKDSFISQFGRQVVGARQHEELWVPAEQLEEMNRNIEGCIKVTGAFFGPDFEGYIPAHGGMRGKNAREQFFLLTSTSNHYPMDFHQEIKLNHLAVFLHFPYWLQASFEDFGIEATQKQSVLDAIQRAWTLDFPEISLPIDKKDN